jgi:hypothetical protein
MEDILKELSALTIAHVEAEKEMKHEDFMQYLKETLHPLEENLEEKVPGFYVIFFEQYRQYGLLPING